MATPTRTTESGPAVRRSAFRRSRGDGPFRFASTGAGVVLLAIMAAIGLFLVVKALPALQANTSHFLTELTWQPNATKPIFGIGALAFGTVLSSLLALLIATPVAVGVALFISHYAPRRLASALGYVVDLLAAVPSVVYGLWGVAFLVPFMLGPSKFLNDYFGWIPLFSGESIVGKSMLTASLVLAIMILPIIAAISREVFLQAPKMQEEAALALGATRWEMIRTAVLPFGRPGVISAAMLGLGRAMGETIAVALIFPATFKISFQILGPYGNSIAANIANGFGEATEVGRGALIASGLVLFLITLLVNMAARFIIARRKEYARAAA
ncbi:phosphate ABC transporter permease subunit PstC [Microbispora triticiradicis]|uniref:Phosphate transport system permease protein n=3 Tax=Microbispora TaxID=2005 RepID=A0ABY3LW99_9ACTN|nr:MULTISPECIES: phosphate ABC transporter permease subunit PstC [Microbispora]RGA02123.1 phosphate ABC transporter permease subunit PstC [Microbispora triticiradicis]TLP51509.1 phosphate ABC transporter permease subunit PstC [Microbispora fusca]TYB57080.1 phosphate ABC transporter permease subunit PstC [Microbispora tritici]